VYVVDAVRTPIGRYAGSLAGVRPYDLAAHVIGGLCARQAELDPSRIDDVVMGAANSAGEDNRNVARMAVLLAGLPVSVPGTTVNRLCGSGLEAVVQAARAVAVGDASICVAGGVESMSRAPWVLPKPDQPFARDDATLISTTLGWRMVNPRMPRDWTITLGEGAELLAGQYEIEREEQDALAVASHCRASAAWEAGWFAAETVPVSVDDEVVLERDEGVRPDTSLEQLSRLRAAFRANGRVTAGNSSQLSDGAAALLLSDESGIASFGGAPLARVRATAVVGVDLARYGLGPVDAVRLALKRADISWQDLRCVELNEAFAAQMLACLREWPDLDPAVVNPLGGAIALGHPIGCTGARLLTTLAWSLRRAGGSYGVAAMCIGVGQGIAVVLEGLTVGCVGGVGATVRQRDPGALRDRVGARRQPS
jgi:acetyl-CoA acetyltransferase family protein